MPKFNRKKIALTLVCASILGGKTQAAQNIKTEQTLAAVGGATAKNSSKGFVNWVKNHKLGVGVGGALTAATAVTLIILGVKYLGKKNKNNNNIDEIPNVKEKNKGKIQQENEKGKFYEKNQKMIEDGIAKLDNELQKIYGAIKKLILNYKEKKLSNYIEKIFDKIDNVNIEDPKNITDKHQGKYIGLLDEFIDIYSGKKELTKFSAEDNDNFGLIVEVQSKDIHYTIYSNEIKVEKVNNNDEVILNMNINVEDFLDLD